MRDYLMKLMAAEWSKPSPPNEECRYDHAIAGDYRIEWKSWKDYPVYDVYWQENHIGHDATLDMAKSLAVLHRIEQGLKALPIPGIGDVLEGKATIIPNQK